MSVCRCGRKEARYEYVAVHIEIDSFRVIPKQAEPSTPLEYYQYYNPGTHGLAFRFNRSGVATHYLTVLGWKVINSDRERETLMMGGRGATSFMSGLSDMFNIWKA